MSRVGFNAASLSGKPVSVEFGSVWHSTVQQQPVHRCALPNSASGSLRQLELQVELEMNCHWPTAPLRLARCSHGATATALALCTGSARSR